MISPEAVAAHKRREKALADSSLDPRQKAAAILDALPPWPDIYWHGADGQPCPCATCSTRALREMTLVLRQLAAGVDLEHEPRRRSA